MTLKDMLMMLALWYLKGTASHLVESKEVGEHKGAAANTSETGASLPPPPSRFVIGQSSVASGFRFTLHLTDEILPDF